MMARIDRSLVPLVLALTLGGCGGADDDDGNAAAGGGGSSSGGTSSGGSSSGGASSGGSSSGGTSSGGSSSGGTSSGGSSSGGASSGGSSSGGASSGGTGGTGTGGPSSWIGIPKPPFGLDETAAGCSGCTTITATNGAQLANLAAGTIVELSSSFSCSGNVVISGTGTATKPIIVRGPSPTQKVKVPCATGIKGSYIIVENLDIDFGGKKLNFGVVDSDHIAVRSSDVHGLRSTSNTTVVFLSNSTDVVLFENSIFDNGDFALAGEIDIHGVGGSNVWGVWILNSKLYSNRGDSVQFGHQANNTLGDVYIGGNDMYDNGENSIDIKETSNVVISQNKLHGSNPLGNVVLHDCPINAAVIYNEIYDENVGVSMASLESACSGLPINLFVLKNDFHDLAANAVEGWGTGKTYYVAGNTFTNVGSAIEIDNVGAGSVITQDASGLSQGFAKFQSVYGLDISSP